MPRLASGPDCLICALYSLDFGEDKVQAFDRKSAFEHVFRSDSARRGNFRAERVWDKGRGVVDLFSVRCSEFFFKGWR